MIWGYVVVSGISFFVGVVVGMERLRRGLNNIIAKQAIDNMLREGKVK